MGSAFQAPPSLLSPRQWSRRRMSAAVESIEAFLQRSNASRTRFDAPRVQPQNPPRPELANQARTAQTNRPQHCVSAQVCQNKHCRKRGAAATLKHFDMLVDACGLDVRVGKADCSDTEHGCAAVAAICFFYRVDARTVRENEFAASTPVGIASWYAAQAVSAAAGPSVLEWWLPGGAC